MAPPATVPCGRRWVRPGGRCPQVLRRVVDLGGDPDTVPAVAGGLAGAVFDTEGIPERWMSILHGRVPGVGDHRSTVQGFRNYAGTPVRG